jgi:uncharacterized protein (DUF427 family)
MWQYDGRVRPQTADMPGPGEESVWDYPRPPRLVSDMRRVLVSVGDHVIADTRRAVRVLETASPPTFYLPPDDIDQTLIVAASGASMCEWKGAASYWTVLLPDGTRIEAVGWSYPKPKPAFAAIAGWLSFYPARLHCEVDGERVRPQPGGFYGGWLTDEIVGPVKGEPGTGHW